MPPDSPSSTDGAGPGFYYSERILRDKYVDEDPAVVAVIDRLVRWRERTRVLEEALRGIEELAARTVRSSRVDAVSRERARRIASLAAVAVEDGGQGEGYERPPAATVTASQGSAEAVVPYSVLIVWAGQLDRFRNYCLEVARGAVGESRNTWIDRAWDFGRLADSIKGWLPPEPSGAGTVAAEPPHDPEERP